jgi:uncharacterized Fe-S center protein
MKKLIISTAVVAMMLSFCPQKSFAQAKGAAKNGGTPTVYLTKEISPESLVKIYKTLGVPAKGRVAVKMSTGEGSNPNYLKPELIKDLVYEVDGTIVECNTAYGNAPEEVRGKNFNR